MHPTRRADWRNFETMQLGAQSMSSGEKIGTPEGEDEGGKGE